MKVLVRLFAATLIALGSSAQAAELLNQFNPANLTGFVGIALDPVSGNLFVYEEFGGDTMHVLDQAGMELATIPSPGVSSNDYDLDFSVGPMTINGVSIPANTLLVFNGDNGPETLYALDDTGAVISSVALETLSLVGGAHIPGTNQVATVDFTGEDFIRILNADDGTEAGFFNPGPPPFDIFYGDLDLAQSTGEITVVSDSQNIVRQLTQQGFCVRELDVGPLGISLMSGVAIDDTTGNLWICDRSGNIYHLDPRPDLGDTDNDGLLDFDDNCVTYSNPDQIDTDGDGVGNACDGDLAPMDGNDCQTNFGDLALIANAFLSTPGHPDWNPDADLAGGNGTPDGVINFADVARFASLFLLAPGPSGRGNLCGCGL